MTTDMSELTIVERDILIESLANWSKKKREETHLPEGKYEFHNEVLFQFDTVVTQKAGGLAVPTVALPLKKILAIALQKAGVQRENIAKIIQEAADEAAKAGDTVTEAMQATEEALERVTAILKTLPKIPRAGGVTVTGDVQILRKVQTKQVSQHA